jgi:uncharacterized cupredoxin-like copper-binding protein
MRETMTCGGRLRLNGYLSAGVLLLGILAGALAGCDFPGMGTGGSTTTRQIPSVTIGAKDMSFDMPESMPASGLLSITIDNQGQQPHQTNIARLNDGVTQDQFTNALKTNPNQALGMATFVGGPNTIDPGKSQTVVVDMPPGNYVAICFLNDTNDPAKTHADEGMIKYFTVPQSSGAQPAELRDNGLVTLHDFSIELPSAGPFHAGQITWKVWNHGGQPHEMTLMKLAQGKTEQDMIAYLGQQTPAGPPPFSDAGGMGGLGLDKSGWVTLTLEAGNYVALCFVPDMASGKPHFMLGMHQAFTVR